MMQFLGRCSRNWIGTFAILIGLVFCPSLWAANIYVSPNGSGAGTIGDPTNFQSALTTAQSNGSEDTIFLRTGTYANGAPYTYTFTDGLTLTISGGWDTNFSVQSTDRELTVLDGGNATRVLDFSNVIAGTVTSVTIENLTIQNGLTSAASEYGAGIRATRSAVDNGSILKTIIRNCLIRDNQAQNSNLGGGMYTDSPFEIYDTAFLTNTAYGGGGITAYPVPAGASNSVIDGCEFEANMSAPAYNGAHIRHFHHLIVRRSSFIGRGSSANYPVSGIFSYNPSYMEISDSIFAHNWTNYWGAAINFYNSSGAVITNTVFIDNRAGLNGDGAGGAIDIAAVSPSIVPNFAITNCTFTGNRTAGGQGYGGAITSRSNGTLNLNITNSIFWDNSANPPYSGLYSEGNVPTISYSDVHGGVTAGFTDGGGNIDLNPGFTPGDYHLPLGSPCIDNGSNAAAAGIPTDIDDEPRIINGTVDMGADEYNPSIPPDPIEIISPDNGATFDTCSYFAPPPFVWKLNQSFAKLELQFYTSANPTKPTKVKLKNPASTMFPMTDKVWKKILKLPGLSGGELNWKIVGTNKGLPIVESEVSTMTIAAPEPAGKPDISPVSKSSLPTLTWGNSCGTKFKAYFSADSAFSKSKKLSFKYQGSINSDDVFSAPLDDKTWGAIRKLVEDVAGSSIYFYVESWDIIKRYQKTPDAYFTLEQ